MKNLQTESDSTAPSDDPAAQYAIAASAALQDRRTRTLKYGDTFAVFDQRGDIGGEPGNSEGLYHRDTRILSQLQLLLEGARPLLLSSMTQDDNAVFSADLSNPDLLVNGVVSLRREQIQVHRAKFIWKAACCERVLVRNFSDRELRVRLAFNFASDFADLFEVRGEKRAARGQSDAVVENDRSVVLRYVGLDQISRKTRVSLDPAPNSLTISQAAYELQLQPGEASRIFLRYGLAEAAGGGPWSGLEFHRQMRAARRALRKSSARAASVDSSNSVFNEIMRRSVSDLYMLVTETDQGRYPYAGTPWFSTPFGRDGIVTALMTLWLDPTIAKGVLHFLAATQATATEPERDAEPGKILHEMRYGEMANLREVPFGRYYGSVDATPLFVWLLGEYFVRTGDMDTVRTLWPNAEAALRWMDTYGDRDGDGFVEYYRQTPDGLANQGWKDSYDAVFHRDGRLAEGPIALCEVQAYVYGAKRHGALLAGSLGHHALAASLHAQAVKLRRQFEEKFWCDDLSVYALALDGAKQPCRVISSNSGQVLLTGIASPERAQRVAQTLLSPASFSGWGIRTIALGESRYNPMAYHNGSVWPHDNGVIAMGMARYGLKENACKIFTALIDAASYMDLRRLPELFCGFTRRQRNAPTQYPVACSPQAWASSASLCVLQAVLGLELFDGSREVAFQQPMLPPFIDRLHLRNLRVGSGSVDVMLHRSENGVAATVTRREEGAIVVVRA